MVEISFIVVMSGLMTTAWLVSQHRPSHGAPSMSPSEMIDRIAVLNGEIRTYPADSAMHIAEREELIELLEGNL